MVLGSVGALPVSVGALPVEALQLVKGATCHE